MYTNIPTIIHIIHIIHIIQTSGRILFSLHSHKPRNIKYIYIYIGGRSKSLVWQKDLLLLLLLLYTTVFIYNMINIMNDIIEVLRLVSLFNQKI